jgi:HK97 family phage major capsid protein
VTKIVIPTAASELEEMLGDRAKIENLMKEGQFGEFITNYARTVHNKDKELGAQVKEQTQLALAEMLTGDEAKVTNDIKRLNMALRTQGGGAVQGKSIYNAKAPGVALDAEFSDLTEFMQMVYPQRANLRDGETLVAKAAKATKIKNSYGTTIPADGGFLVPEVLRAELLALALESGITRPRATVIAMEGGRVPIPTVDDTSHASSVFGGVVCYWTEEAGALQESVASFSRVVLDAKKLTAYAVASSELLQDGSAFSGFLTSKLPQALAWFEDDAFMNGSGVGEPQGWLNASASVSVTKESGQAADTVVWENIVKMYARMLPSSLGSAVWVASHDTFPELATMALSVGTGGSAIWLNNGVQGPPMTILGRPVLFTEKVNTLGTAGDINFVDFSYYLIGDRQAIQADTSPHYRFQNDQTTVRFIERVDGRPWIQSAITPNQGSNTLSPFVQLETRS